MFACMHCMHQFHATLQSITLRKSKLITSSAVSGMVVPFLEAKVRAP